MINSLEGSMKLLDNIPKKLRCFTTLLAMKDHSTEYKVDHSQVDMSHNIQFEFDLVGTGI